MYSAYGLGNGELNEKKEFLMESFATAYDSINDNSNDLVNSKYLFIKCKSRLAQLKDLCRGHPQAFKSVSDIFELVKALEFKKISAKGFCYKLKQICIQNGISPVQLDFIEQQVDIGDLTEQKIKFPKRYNDNIGVFNSKKFINNVSNDLDNFNKNNFRKNHEKNHGHSKNFFDDFANSVARDFNQNKNFSKEKIPTNKFNSDKIMKDIFGISKSVKK